MNINISGRSITVPDGSSVSIKGNTIYVNGQPWHEGDKLSGIVKIVVEGQVGKLDVEHGNVEVHGDVAGNVECGGSCQVTGSIGRDLDAGGSVQCGDVMGNVSAVMSVNCLNVGGDVDASGNVCCGKVGGTAECGGSNRHEV